jgi:dihydroxyacetone kinase-like predicted kinase
VDDIGNTQATCKAFGYGLCQDKPLLSLAEVFPAFDAVVAKKIIEKSEIHNMLYVEACQKRLFSRLMKELLQKFSSNCSKPIGKLTEKKYSISTWEQKSRAIFF